MVKTWSDGLASDVVSVLEEIASPKWPASRLFYVMKLWEDERKTFKAIGAKLGVNPPWICRIVGRMRAAGLDLHVRRSTPTSAESLPGVSAADQQILKTFTSAFWTLNRLEELCLRRRARQSIVETANAIGCSAAQVSQYVHRLRAAGLRLPVFSNGRLSKKSAANADWRSCLTCGARFWSWGVGNRRCGPCKSGVDDSGCFPEVALAVGSLRSA